MGKVKNIIAMTAASAFAALSLTVGASALTRIVIGNSNTKSLIHAGTGYWYGTFTWNDISAFGDTYTDSSYADFTIQSGRTAKITGKGSYTGNYKEVGVHLVSTGTSKYSNNAGTSTTVQTTAPSPGVITHAQYVSSILNGTGAFASFLDGYIIEVDKS